LENRPLILLTNDDGINAKGINSALEVVKEFGDVVLVSTQESRSGMSHAITIKEPLRMKKVFEEGNVTKYMTNGTPADGVKLLLNSFLDRKPDLIVSGINHGSNASISVIYSGTMGAAIEGSFYGIPAVGLSLLDHMPDADFSAAKIYSKKIIAQVLENGLDFGVSLNVNFPTLSVDEIKGIKVTRQTKGAWIEKFDRRKDPMGGEYFWLTGYYENYEPEATDTDEWAVNNGYVAITPIQVDMTAYNAMKKISAWKI
jgi:5'-nucleotidase